MKSLPLFSSLLILSLALYSPEAAQAHAGHGDEFQASGGINRVEVKPETDPLLGIQVSSIEADNANNSDAVLVPVTALVEDNGRQLVFVQYQNFYEPVEVTTGDTQGELIEVTQGLSIGEQLVTQGSLSLYAESRKTQTAEADESSSATASATASNGNTAVGLSEAAHAEADAKGIPHSHSASSHSASSHDEAEQLAEAGGAEEGGLSTPLLAAAGGGIGLVVGAIVLLKGRSGKGRSGKGRSDEKEEV